MSEHLMLPTHCDVFNPLRLRKTLEQPFMPFAVGDSTLPLQQQEPYWR